MTALGSVLYMHVKFGAFLWITMKYPSESFIIVFYFKALQSFLAIHLKIGKNLFSFDVNFTAKIFKIINLQLLDAIRVVNKTEERKSI